MRYDSPLPDGSEYKPRQWFTAEDVSTIHHIPKAASYDEIVRCAKEFSKAYPIDNRVLYANKQTIDKIPKMTNDDPQTIHSMLLGTKIYIDPTMRDGEWRLDNPPEIDMLFVRKI